MKPFLFASVGLMLTFCSSAQENVHSKSSTSLLAQKQNELGLFGQAMFVSAYNSNEAVMGLQYKRWVKPYLAYRILAGYNPYSYSDQPWITEAISKDTVRVRYDKSQVDMFFAGFGIEVQRQFYKSVHFFAAVDILGGYGSGYYRSYNHKAPITGWNLFTDYSPSGHSNERYEKAYLRVLPSAGAKFIFNRIGFGAEAGIMNLSVDCKKIGDSPAYASADFDLFNSYSTYRLFVNYRF